MLTISLFAILIASVSAHDDQSLMQHQLGVDATSGTQRGLKVLGDGLAEIPNLGKASKMAIDALMTSAEQTPGVNSLRQTLQDLMDLLDLILAEQSALRDASQVTLNALHELIGPCGLSKKATEATSRSDMDDAKKAVEDCYPAVDDAFHDQQTKCDAVLAILNANSENICEQFENMPTSPDAAARLTKAAWTELFKDWNDIVEEYKKAYENSLKHLDSTNQECLDSKKTYESELATCHGLQDQHELSVCAWKTAHLAMCADASADCALRRADYEAAWSTALGEATIRIETVAQVRFVRCLAEKWRAALGNNLDLTDGDISDCNTSESAPYDHLQADYNVTKSPYGAPWVCPDVTDPSYIYPEHGSTFLAEYNVNSTWIGAYFAQTTRDCSGIV